MTEKAGTALIFDEVITGFRVHPGGTQALFGISADLATYGKVLGGGLPLGVVAGKRAFMDALDGGAWRFGDDSFPETGVTFFAGTFVRHPLAMAAALAVLHRLKAAGPALPGRSSTRRPRDWRLGSTSASKSTGCRAGSRTSARSCSSGFPSDQRLASLLFYHLREKGVHIWEGFPCFVTEAHTEKDLDFVVRAFESSAAEMQSGGLLPSAGRTVEARRARRAAAAATSPAAQQAEPSATFPLTDSQQEIWLACQMGAEASCAFNEGVSLRLRGPLDVSALTTVPRGPGRRHDALRTTFDPSGDFQRVATETMTSPDAVADPADGRRRPRRELRQILAEEARFPSTSPAVRSCAPASCGWALTITSSS